MTASSTESRVIAKRYVRALFDLASEQNALPAVEKDFLQFQNLLGVSSELNKFLRNPVISRDKSAQAMETLLKQFKASDITRRFFALLAANRRLPVIGDVIELFMQELAASRDELLAEVTSARALSKTELSALEGSLKKSTGKVVRLRTRERPEILGGLQLRIGGRMIDQSVHGQLERLRGMLKTRAHSMS